MQRISRKVSAKSAKQIDEMDGQGKRGKSALSDTCDLRRGPKRAVNEIALTFQRVIPLELS